MFRWLFVCLVLCGGTFGVLWLVYRDSIKNPPAPPANTLGDAAKSTGFQGGEYDVRPSLMFASNATTIQGARILMPEKTELGSERDGQIMALCKEMKPGETAPPDRMLPPQTLLYLAVEVAFDPTRPAEEYPLAGAPDDRKYDRDNMVPAVADGKLSFFTLSKSGSKGESPLVYTRWKDGMPLWAGHVLICADQPRRFRKLDEQDKVEAGEIIALIKPDLAIGEFRIKHIKLTGDEAERVASAKTRDEAFSRLERLEKLRQTGGMGTIAKEEYDGAKLQFERYTQEELQKRAAVRSGEVDVMQAMRVLSLHQVRAPISGTVQTIYKNQGDNIKQFQEPMMQIVNTSSLRAEARAEQQDTQNLHKGMPVQLEVSLRSTPSRTLTGTHQAINAVVVTRGSKPQGGGPVRRPLIVAAGEDQSLRAWDAATGQPALREPMRLPYPARALACTGKDAANDMLLLGLADGSVYAINMEGKSLMPVALPERHRGPIIAAAISPDGMVCATAGEDRAIRLWVNKDGTWKSAMELPEAHRAAVTSLSFTTVEVEVPVEEPAKTAEATPAMGDGAPKEEAPKKQQMQKRKELRLISAGRDNSVNVWGVEESKPADGADKSADTELRLVNKLEVTRRGGEVSQIGTHGDRMMFDSGKELRVLSLLDGQLEGVLRSDSSAAAFSTLAIFDPSGRYILTNGGSEGRPQIWRAPPRKGSNSDPLAEGRGSEALQLSGKSPATCGAFDPAGAFAVTGTADGQLFVWDLKDLAKVAKRIPATIGKVGNEVDLDNRVPVQAELKDPPAWLVPGSTATIVVEGK